MSLTRLTGLIVGAAIFIAMLLMPTPATMEASAWRVAALTVLMAIWWMTEALPLTVTALLPFLLVPMFGVMNADEIASEYYSPILFLLLGGAFLALAIERTGLHRRLALNLLKAAKPTASGLLLAFMASAAILSMLISNTSTTLIMTPIALAVLQAGGVQDDQTQGFAGAVMMGIAFAASIGGLGTLVGSPTNAIAATLIEKQLGVTVSFLDWMMFGIPMVIVSIPIAMLILSRVQRLSHDPFNGEVASKALGEKSPWSQAEKRLIPIFLLVFATWVGQPWLKQFLPAKALTDGTVAIAGSFLLFILPDGSGRPMLTWKEANRAPWGVIMLFGGGLALAAAMTQSGLAAWLGLMLAPLTDIHSFALVLIIVALTIVVTEFASNVATASGIIPVLAALIAATGSDPILLAMPVAMAASWGFMLPSGTGPNAIVWATGHIALPRMVKAGFLLDLIGAPLLVIVVWTVAMFT